MNDPTYMMKLTSKGWVLWDYLAYPSHIIKRITTPYMHIKIIIICLFVSEHVTLLQISDDDNLHLRFF